MMVRMSDYLRVGAVVCCHLGFDGIDEGWYGLKVEAVLVQHCL